MMLEDRLWPRVREDDRGCWIWTGAQASGYGVIGRDGRQALTHRVAYELIVGVIPEGLELDHLCRSFWDWRPDMTVTLVPPRAAQRTPERTFQQRREALRHANDIRSARAQLKRDIKAGHVEVRSLLLNPPSYLDTMRVWDLMLATPKWGRVKVNKTLSTGRVSPSKRIGGLSSRQRVELADALARTQR